MSKFIGIYVVEDIGIKVKTIESETKRKAMNKLNKYIDSMRGLTGRRHWDIHLYDIDEIDEIA